MIEVKYIDHWPKDHKTGTSMSDRELALAAWVSTYSEEKASEKSHGDVLRVVSDIIDLAHDTPKENVWVKFAITCPIFVERQFDKYRMTQQWQDITIETQFGEMGRFNVTQDELSGRYRTIPARYLELPDDVASIVGLQISNDYHSLLESQHHFYRSVLTQFAEWRNKNHPRNDDYKRIREVLRGVLGTAYMTDMRLSMNLNAFEHILCQRLAPGAQIEAQIVARKMFSEAITNGVCPHALVKMADKHGWWEVLKKEEV